jgi:S1-C subfamily serine protease
MLSPISTARALAIAVCAFGVAVWFNQTPVSAQDTGFARVYQTDKSSVVYIVSALSSGAASGSGFIYSSTGSSSTIITANHVIEGASRVDVILDSDVHQRYPATVTMRDHVRDVAVLTIQVGNRRALALADPAKINEGSDIAVIGYPRAASSFESIFADDLRPSVHVGIISAVRLKGEIIQFDAQTDHGDSGGPVIDKSTGAVIAIVRGSILDPAYRARGLEQPLPGSNFGMSVATINQVLSGAPPAASAAAAASIGTASSASGAGTPTTPTTGGTAVALAGGSSAAYRVGYGAPHYTNATVENISQSVLQRLANSFSSQSAFYMIPVSFGIVKENGQQLSGVCDDNRLNAIVQPAVGWRAPLIYTATGAPASLEATVSLLVTDCSGGPVYYVKKTKTEGTRFAHRAADVEVIDMSNDLLDQAMLDFSNFRAAHADAWDTLLKTGLFVDPMDGKYHSLFGVNTPISTTDIRVISVYTNGPAARGGLQIGDVIKSVNGQSVLGMSTAQGLALMNVPNATLVVMRPGGETTLTIQPEKYDQLVSALKR